MIASLLFFGSFAQAQEATVELTNSPEQPASEPSNVAPERDDFECSQGSWDFEGAEAAAGPSATYNDDWTPRLAEVAQCLLRPEFRSACLTIQGQFDTTHFPDSVVSGFGSELATQQTRARGRAGLVESKLHELEVASERLRQLPPPTRPSFRGVKVALLLDCIAVPAEPVAAPNEPPHQKEEVSTDSQEVMPPEPDLPGPFWLQVGLSGRLRFDEPDDIVSGLLSVGAGWKSEHWYGYGTWGLHLGSTNVQRVGQAFSLGGGYSFLHWLSAGLYAGYERSSADLFDAWLDQALLLGIDSHQCLSFGERFEACAREGLVPLGYRIDRGMTVGESTFQVPEETAHFWRIELGAVLRVQL